MIEFDFCKVGYKETLMLLGAWSDFFDAMTSTIASIAIMEGKAFEGCMNEILESNNKDIKIKETIKNQRKMERANYPDIISASMLNVVIKGTEDALPLVTVDESGIFDNERLNQFLDTHCLNSPDVLEEFLKDIWIKRLDQKPNISSILKKKQEEWELYKQPIMKEVLQKL